MKIPLISVLCSKSEELHFRKLFAGALNVYTWLGKPDGKAKIIDENGVEVFDPAPLGTLLLIAASEKELKNAAKIHNDLSERFVTPVEHPKLVAKDATTDLIKEIVEAYEKQYSFLSAEYIDSLQEIAVLRQSVESLQINFHQLEGYVSRIGNISFETVFQTEPVDGQYVSLSCDEYPEKIFQLLPSPSTGVCGFSIHLAARPDSSGTLLIGLWTVEDDILHAEWEVEVEQLKLGWNRFALNSSLTGIARTMRLELCMSTGLAWPKLSLGLVHPYPKYQLCYGNRSNSINQRHLAVAILTGLPGIVAPTIHGFITPKNSPHIKITEYRLPAEVLCRVKQDHRNVVDPQWVSFIKDGNYIFCHPPAVGCTVALLDEVFHGAVARISSEVYIAGEKSEAIEFSLAIYRRRHDGELVEVMAAPWLVVSRDQRKFVNIYLDDRVDPQCILGFRTKMKIEGQNLFAWARFENVVISYEG